METIDAQSEISTSGLKTKNHYTGKVIKTSLAGALVEIGEKTPAYLHVSQLSSTAEGAPKSVAELLKPGQEIEVWVKRIKEGRVELTMVKPMEYEWRDLKKDMVVSGKVVRIEKFGIFVEIGAERPGLVHISEIAHGFIKAAEDVVKEGDEVEAQILDIDRKKKQIKLSMKALTPEPEKVQEAAPRAKPSGTSDTVAPSSERGSSERTNTERSNFPRGERKGGKRRESSSENYTAYMQTETPSEPELTAMEIAYRDAMGSAKTKRSIAAEKHKRAETEERDEIFSRTLTNKIKTS
ncbi:MAG: S1 RNA-binding domain-containing protein [Leptolinea sp.]